MKHLTRLIALFIAFAAGLHAADSRKKLVMLVSEAEYETAKTLPVFAKQFLESDYRVVIHPERAAGDAGDVV
jgi:hypothetical protein